MIKKEWYLIGGICLAVGGIIGFLAGRLSYHKPKQLQQDSCDCGCALLLSRGFRRNQLG